MQSGKMQSCVAICITGMNGTSTAKQIQDKAMKVVYHSEMQEGVAMSIACMDGIAWRSLLIRQVIGVNV
jgi:hypothetical protein